MGTKSPRKTESIIELDSDCEIQDANLSLITIPDSDEAVDTTQTQSDLDITTEHTDFDEKNFLLEVNFKSSDLYTELKEFVRKGLLYGLKEYGPISIEDDGEGIQVFRVPVPEPESEEDVIDISGLFTIDTKPAEKVDAIQIPSYKRTIKEILDDSCKKKESEDKCQRPKHSKSCFNCGETDHDLRSCPKPRNSQKINKAKKKHLFKHERYHVDIEQRFAHLRPGQVSSQLREALSIRGGELPFFFYRMRVLGYPPGWLEDAKVAHSGISLFDSEGRSVRDPDREEGEIDAERHKYDVNKIISFPGFNADPGPHFYDDHKYHNVPPLDPQDFKDRFITMLGDNVVKGYKRKKLKDLPEGECVKKPALEASEMDIDNDDNAHIAIVEFTRPPPPPTPPPTAPPPPTPPSPPPAERSPSPSLEDLEARQKRLLQELESNTSLTSGNDDSLIDELIQLESENVSAPTTPTLKSPEMNIESETTCNNGDLTPKTPMAIATESVLGTPVLKFSPFDKLPCGDSFMVGVSDVINFENLPDSTGTYEKMKGVIKKVRTAVTQLNNEDS